MSSPPSSSPGAGRTAVVIGGGYVGAYTAYCLRRDGWSVRLLERHDDGVGLEMSFLNGGLLCPSLTLPWSNAGALKLVAKSYLDAAKASLSVFNAGEGRDGGGTTIAVGQAAFADLHFWRWMARFFREIIPGNVRRNHRASYELADYALRMMEGGPVPPEDYGRWAQGSLQTCSTEAMVRSTLEAVINEGHALTAAETELLEPALAGLQRPIVGSVHTPADSSGDIHAYTRGLIRILTAESAAEYAESEAVVASAEGSVEEGSVLGGAEGVGAVGFGFDLRCGEAGNVQSYEWADDADDASLEADGGGGRRLAAVVTADGCRVSGDAFVVAAGNGAEDIASLAGDCLLTYPIKGYVLEVPRASGRPALQHNVVDDVNKVYVSPINEGSAVRISGFAEFGSSTNPDWAADPTRWRQLLRMAEDFLPDGYLAHDLEPGYQHFTAEEKAGEGKGGLQGAAGGEHPSVTVHGCLRSQTPDDLPVIGQSPRCANVWYNAAHGHIGWTRGAGSAHLLADLMAHRTPALDAAPFSPARFGGAARRLLRLVS